MWAIASIPFWLIGITLLLLALACVGTLFLKWREMTTEKAAEGMQYTIVLSVLAGIAFIIAAKIAS